MMDDLFDGSDAHLLHDYDDCNICVRRKLKEVLALLAEVEPCLNECDFHITLQERVREALK